MSKGFEITNNKGFHITFKNGITVSVQFGRGNYCANRHLSNNPPEVPKCPTAEIALWDASGKWITKRASRAIARKTSNDDVIGWLSPEEIAKYIRWASRQKDTHKEGA